MKKNYTAYALIGFGVVLLLGSVIYYFDSRTTAEPTGLGDRFLEILVVVLGAGSSFVGWKSLMAADGKKAAPASSQTNIGDNNTNIQAGTVHVHPPAPKEIEVHPALGSIPPANPNGYVKRGDIENKVREALRRGGASAVVGLHAPGGTGKTELANHIAQEVKAGKYDFEDVLWVNVNDKTPAEVVSEALRLCGIQLPPAATETDKRTELHHFLLSRKLLVIFDDVRANAAGGLRDFLPPAPCAALVTSRIQQMAGVKDFALDQMEPEQARELFVNSLGEDVVRAEEAAVFKLAERCRYNPLALEIASKRIRQNRGFAEPVKFYYEKAEKRFEELRMHGDERWNMTGVFDLSYNDLTETDQRYFRALSVFAPSGFAPEAAAFLWGIALSEAGTALSRFINLSLVIPVKGGLERYRLHDLLDEYAAPKLGEAGDEEKVVHGIAEWLIDLCEENFTLSADSIPLIKPEFDNFEKTINWALRKKEGKLAAKLATKPRNWMMNYFRELDKWQSWLICSLDFEIKDLDLKANVLQAIGDVQQFRDDRDAALESYNEALKLFRQVGAKLGEANVLSSLNHLELLLSGDLKLAEFRLSELISMRRAINDVFSEGADNFNFAVILTTMGLWDEANRYCLISREILQKVGENTPVLQTIRLEKGISILKQITIVLPKDKSQAMKLLIEAKNILEPTGEPPLFAMLNELSEKCHE